MLWRASLDQGEMPYKLKESKVIPIYKSGDRAEPKNYRPISLTSHISKVFEKVVVKKIVEYLDHHNLFNDAQHGFRSGRSCLSQLLDHQLNIISLLEKKNEVDVVYLDFAKAFDKVDYGIVVKKLKRLGISGKMLKWINSFLRGRSQRVCVDGVLSERTMVSSGVPQGSSLGPLLFLIHIHDIDDELSFVTAASFADDTRIMGGIRTDADRAIMQEDLEKIYDWAKNNNMKFNGSKFELILYGELNIDAPLFTQPNGLDIQQVETVRDLGVLMDKKLTFKPEISSVCLKSKRQAGWIMRVFKTRAERPMLTLFKALVRPHLEYACQLWSPLKLGQVGRLEGIQRTYTARISGLGHLNYWERLKKLNLYSLERRRERYQIIYVFKIISGVVPNFTNERFKLRPTLSARRGCECLVPPINTGSTARFKTLTDNSFAIRGPRLFNILPRKLRDCGGSVDQFKAWLDCFLPKVRDQPRMPGYFQSSTSNSLIDQVSQMKREGLLLFDFSYP